MTADRIAELEAEVARLTAECEASMQVIARERHRATNAEYMGAAYLNMLGENGRAVAKMWAAKGVRRIHFDWGDEAGNLSGEERAKFILEIEDAPSRLIAPGEIDGDFATTEAIAKPNSPDPQP